MATAPDEFSRRSRFQAVTVTLALAAINAFGVYNSAAMGAYAHVDATIMSLLIALFSLSLFGFYLFLLRWRYAIFLRDVQQIAEEEDTDLVLVNKIAKAVRPSLASTFFVNTLFFVLGLVAAAYTPEVRQSLDTIFAG